jgi:uncharacterized protein YodC (DUF2158 family)
MNEHQWNPGDLVGVKSGGPTMTVAGLEMGKVICEWFDGAKQMGGVFTPSVLEKRLSPSEAMKSAAEDLKKKLR